MPSCYEALLDDCSPRIKRKHVVSAQIKMHRLHGRWTGQKRFRPDDSELAFCQAKRVKPIRVRKIGICELGPAKIHIGQTGLRKTGSG